MHLACELFPGEGTAQRRFNGGGLVNIPNPIYHQPHIWPMRQNKPKSPKVVHLRIAIHRDVIDIGKPNACLPQAVSDRLNRQPRPVFNPEKALLFRRGNQNSITDDASR